MQQLDAGLAVGLLGPPAFVRQQCALLAAWPAMRLAGCWCGVDTPAVGLPPGVRRSETAEALLHGTEVDVVAVGAPVGERAYWCGAVLAAGKQALSAVPPAPSRQELRALVAQCGAGGTALHLVDATDVSPIAGVLAAGGPVVRQAVYYDLDVQIAASSLLADDAGVLRQAAIGYLSRLAPLTDDLDTVRAETRSLLWGRLAADVAVAYTHSVDGTEGAIWVGGLGPSSHARLRVHGLGGSGCWLDAGAADAYRSWSAAYGRLLGCAPAGGWWPLSLRQVMRGLELAEWMERAARHQRTVSHREIMT